MCAPSCLAVPAIIAHALHLSLTPWPAPLFAHSPHLTSVLCSPSCPFPFSNHLPHSCICLLIFLTHCDSTPHTHAFTIDRRGQVC